MGFTTLQTCFRSANTCSLINSMGRNSAKRTCLLILIFQQSTSCQPHIRIRNRLAPDEAFCSNCQKGFANTRLCQIATTDERITLIFGNHDSDLAEPGGYVANSRRMLAYFWAHALIPPTLFINRTNNRTGRCR